ncbi:MAG: hypothetical protein RR576_03210 [Oscillospiraceae bacterium]
MVMLIGARMITDGSFVSMPIIMIAVTIVNNSIKRRKTPNFRRTKKASAAKRSAKNSVTIKAMLNA